MRCARCDVDLFPEEEGLGICMECDRREAELDAEDDPVPEFDDYEEDPWDWPVEDTYDDE